MSRGRSTCSAAPRNPMLSSMRSSTTVGGRLRDGRDLLVAELELRRVDGVGDVLDLGRARDRDDGRALGEQPRERDLLRRDVVRLGRRAHRVDRVVGVGLADAAERRPGQERDPALRARVDLALGQRRRVAERELVLDRDDLDDPQRLLELLDRAVGEADPAHLALVLELLERAHRLGVGDVRVGAVVLVEVDAVGAERLQRGLAGRADVLGAAVELPRAAGADVARLGGDEHVVAAALEGLGDQPLVVADLVLAGAVGVGGVDQGHAGVERGVDDADRLRLVGAAVERQRHPAEPDRKDLGVRQAAACRLNSCHHNHLPVGDAPQTAAAAASPDRTAPSI